LVKKKLLVVEDEPDVASLQKDFFEMHDFSVDIVSNGYEAAQSLQVSRYDFIFSDIKMPKADGYYLLEKFNQCAYTGSKPKFFFVTGVPEFDVEEALSLGADGVFPKPINFGRILSVIHKYNI
jgi:DNA-binding response OmpR family regulator